MWLFVIIAVIFIVYKIVSEKCQKPYEPKDLRNTRQLTRDTYDPNISPKQLDRNIRNGKYR